MRQITIVALSEKEEEFVETLRQIGMRRTVAKVLVFLLNTPPATSRAIERGTDLRQPEVSIALRYLEDQGWVKCEAIPPEQKGRPHKLLSLAMPAQKIITAIEQATVRNTDNRLKMVKKMRSYA